jgi:hypothetical protein
MIRLPDIVAAVAEAYGLTVRALCDASRRRPLPEARHLAMLLARQYTEASFPEIARALGRRDHSTAMQGRTGTARRLASGEACDAELVLRRNLAVALLLGGTGEPERVALEMYLAVAREEAQFAADVQREERRAIRATRALNLRRRAEDRAEERALAREEAALELDLEGSHG